MFTSKSFIHSILEYDILHNNKYFIYLKNIFKLVSLQIILNALLKTFNTDIFFHFTQNITSGL